MTDRVRRNGQLSSCEPCRKSKLRCDHKRPICGRCARRRLSEQQCHYHPAPMGKQLTPQSERGSPYQQHVARSMTVSSSPPPGDSRPYEPINMNRNLMCFADPNTPHLQRTYTSLTRTGVTAPQPFLPDQHLICEGARLLNDVIKLVTEIGDPLGSLPTWKEICFIHGPLVQAAWKVTHNDIKGLSNDVSGKDLNSISRTIFERTSSPLFFPPTAADGALESAFASQGLRWDMIGLFCAHVGIYLGGEQDKTFDAEAHKTWNSDRKTLMQKAFQACLQCESFCNHIGAVNDITLWFLLAAVLFATWCYGDDSYHVLRLTGSMTSVFFALGFHRGVDRDTSMPFYMKEIRKRAIAWAHDTEKVLAAFTSRPVHLSRHFCKSEIPLDLPDPALTGTEEAILAACENLDEDGWRKDKVVSQVSRHRVLAILCPIREEALELKLAIIEVQDIEAKSGRILRKLKSTWQSIPSHLKIDVSQQWKEQTDTSLILLSLRLEYLYTEFILHSLLAPRSQKGRENLMKTAQEVLNLVLLPTRKRDLLQSQRADMEWTLVFYAMPCASVLVLELLRQKQQPGEQLVFNRSGVIQDISVLISCCDSLTESGQSNYQTCKQAQSIFSKSLDSILNNAEVTQGSKPPDEITVRSREQQDQIVHEQSKSMSPGSPNVVAQDPEWMAWLDSLGMQGDAWLDSIIPTSDFPMDETA